jgi:ferredoxin
MKVNVDYARCAALGICESLAPGIFEVDDDGNLNLLKDDICSTDLHDVEEAVATCPTGALRISS